MPRRFAIGSTPVDLDAQTAGGAELTTIEVGILELLVARQGQVVSRMDLYREVWGYRSRPRGRALDFAIMRLRAKVEVGHDAGSLIQTVRGVGFRLADVEAPLRPVPVPAPADAFIGRTEALSTLAALFADAWLVTVVGPAGVGKSRLALEFAESRPRLRLFASAAEAGSTADLASLLGAGLGLSGADLSTQLGAALAARPETLVIIDDAEEATGWLGAALLSWRRAAPRVRWLVTSRRPLRISGEHILPLPPLSEEQATALLVARARAASGNPALSPDADLLRVVRQLDGLPLAIELAAARTRLLGMAQLAAALDDRFRILRAPGGATRHRSLAAALASSWAALPEAAQQALFRLASFHSPFSLQHAEAMLTDLDEWPLDLIEQLVDHSFLQVISGASFRMLEAVRAFAREQRASQEDTDAIAARHARLFQTPALCRPEYLEDLKAGARLRHHPEVAAGCLVQLVRFLRNNARYDEAVAWIDRWEPLAQYAPDVQARLLHERGWIALQRRHHANALPFFDRLLALDPPPADRYRGAGWLGRGAALMSLGDREGSVAALDAAEVLLADDPAAMSAVYNYRASWGPFPLTARDNLRIGLSHARTCGRTDLLIGPLINLGICERAIGDLDQARRHLEEAMRHSRAISFRRLYAYALCGLVMIEVRRGDLDRAESLAEEAVALTRLLADATYRAEADLRRAEVHLARGEPDAARTLLAPLEGTAVSWLLSNDDFADAWAQCG